MVKAELNNFALEKQLPRMAESGIEKNITLVQSFCIKHPSGERNTPMLSI
tara:strand:+ start:190 stop:339 length:150 start_codon:yes stop_codon:yes gene_type:complete